jgi:ribosomal protein S18 acetylase RimI-like enzyme
MAAHPTLRAVIVRPASPSDAEAIEAVRIRGWQVAYRHVFPPHELDALALEVTRWRRRLRRPPDGWSTLVAQEHGRVLGFASLGPSRDEPGVGELYAIYVDPDRWSRGAGRALIAAVEARLAETYGVATLWVLEANDRARRFYEAAGWRTDGARQTVERLGVAAPEIRYRKSLGARGSSD